MNNFKFAILIIICSFLTSCKKENPIVGSEILNSTVKKHDPRGNWEKANFNLHIQEPRIGNPHRYSIIKLNNSTNSFELIRNRDEHISTHILDENGNSKTFFNGEIETDSLLIKKYRLEPKRNKGYKDFYHFLYGLPMSLNKSYEIIRSTSETTFNNVPCYMIEVELNKVVLSKFWRIFISKSDDKVKGVEIFFPLKSEKGERLYFEGEILLQEMKIPRVRHWHALSNNTYSGSDVIVKEIETNSYE